MVRGGIPAVTMRKTTGGEMSRHGDDGPADELTTTRTLPVGHMRGSAGREPPGTGLEPVGVGTVGSIPGVSLDQGDANNLLSMGRIITIMGIISRNILHFVLLNVMNIEG